MAAHDGFLHINPASFIQRVMRDFERFIEVLRLEPDSEVARNFVALWDKRWNESEPPYKPLQPPSGGPVEVE